jgi:hypothetical protein
MGDRTPKDSGGVNNHNKTCKEIMSKDDYSNDLRKEKKKKKWDSYTPQCTPPLSPSLSLTLLRSRIELKLPPLSAVIASPVCRRLFSSEHPSRTASSPSSPSTTVGELQRGLALMRRALVGHRRAILSAPLMVHRGPDCVTGSQRSWTQSTSFPVEEKFQNLINPHNLT